jgi:N4-gp56 family major capsid protein
VDLNEITSNSDVQTSIQEFWSKDTMRHQLRKGFWPRFAGPEGSGAAFIRKTELVGGGGDLIHIQVTSPLAGSGISGDETQLEGNEEDLSTSEIKVDTTMYRHAVRNYRRANKKSLLDLRGEARFRLAEWGANKMDVQRWAQFVSTDQADVPDTVYTPNTYVIGGGTDEGDITTGSTLSVEAIRTIRYKMLDQEATPLEIDGLPRFFLVISPEMEWDLKHDADYDNYVVNAADRGMGSNPIFTGAIAMIDGVVVLPHHSVPSASDGGSGGTLRYSRALCFGQEAFVEALDEDVTWVERDFDYGNQLGVAYGFAFGPRRGLEKNSLQVIASAAVPS